MIFTDSPFDNRIADQHVVVLINYLRRHHVLTFKEVAKRVGKLTILVSTPMEGDRAWEPEWEGLDVVIQRNYTLTLSRSSGFDEKNFIHFPWDTFFQLRRLKPDVVLSYEMGVRTMFCSMFRMLHRDVPLIMIGNMSHHIESKRGRFRRGFRKIIQRGFDGCTYNGPSCKRYLKEIGFEESDLFHFPYCFDIEKTYQGEKEFSADGVRKLLYCGALSERKAILPFTKLLGRYCDSQLDYPVELVIAGDGPLRHQLESLEYKHLRLEIRGNCDKQQLRECYREADVLVFPTRGDEWGLVPVEAWASGVPVLGSLYSQSMETLGLEGQNGWLFDIKDMIDTRKKIELALNTSKAQLVEFGKQSRKSVEPYSPELAANSLCSGVAQVLLNKAVPKTEDASAQVATRTPATPKTNGHFERTPKLTATLSLDLDNKWSYLKSHDNPEWEAFPSYLNLVVPRILDILDDLDLKITFFVVGQDAVIPENQDAISMIAERGHEIANHSFHHEPCLHLYSPDQLECEFEMAEQAITKLSRQQLLGFRGPGFSLSDETLKLLSRRSYLYDCTVFPTYLAPVARAYYFMTGSFDKQQRKERKAMFGKFEDGFAPNYPYLWTLAENSLLEIPVTTMPGIKTPVHATYLHYLASFSPLAARAYWKSALALYEFNAMSPSFLLHPLDFLGVDDEPDLQFFPGMKTESRYKLAEIRRYLETFTEKFEIVRMADFAKMALNGDLERRSVSHARPGVS